MDDQPQSQPFPSPSPPGGGGEEAAKREQEANSETKPKSAVRCNNNNNNLFGRHRITAAITRLQNEISIIEDELQKLESIGEASTVCQELVSSVESFPDPLLPETRGPTDANWDQWFRGAHGSRNHRRWI
ncbi:guanine nucleotide-binding protein subunit gamma 2-like [Momordica charantia]|uniref:Guanine nucleotide-binding protein subunit gamma 2-like n=1 Tax=Momordica charantia TaxID=3673 RepID=A0A6J1DUG2_MOMCH|nr:guanine nucleotide-binding protein subunit gamma 2-like [Momordica charantia]